MLNFNLTYPDVQINLVSFYAVFLRHRDNYRVFLFSLSKNSTIYAACMKKDKPIVVIKVGSSVITDEGGNLNIRILENIVFQASQLFEQYNIILVSSGAVSSEKIQ